MFSGHTVISFSYVKIEKEWKLATLNIQDEAMRYMNWGINPPYPRNYHRLLERILEKLGTLKLDGGFVHEVSTPLQYNVTIKISPKTDKPEVPPSPQLHLPWP